MLRDDRVRSSPEPAGIGAPAARRGLATGRRQDAAVQPSSSRDTVSFFAGAFAGSGLSKSENVTVPGSFPPLTTTFSR